MYYTCAQTAQDKVLVTRKHNLMGEDLLFPRDILRKQYFPPEHVEHGAKLEIRTLLWLVERYTKKGDTILDPMSGIGTSQLAATMGRNVINIELFDRFVEIQHLTFAKLGQVLGFNANVSIEHNDLRAVLPLAKPVDAVIFSPPYGSVMRKQAKRSKLEIEKRLYTGYGGQFADIGDLGNYAAYLSSMREVYRLCALSMKPGAPLISITKDYVKDRKRIYVSADNIREALKSGLVFEDWHRRYTDPRIWQIKSRKDRQAEGTDKRELHIDWEDLLVFRKPNGP